MADAIDEIYLGHLAEADMVQIPTHECVNGHVLVPRRALSSLVEHRCSECQLVVEQTFAEYMALSTHRTGDRIVVTCPKKTLRRKERRRRYG